MHTLLLPPEILHASDDQILPEAQTHHLVTVLRAKQGEKLELTDGNGYKRNAEISQLAKRFAAIHFTSEAWLVPAPTVEIVLFQCIAKPARMDWLVEKAQELGVKRLVPIISEYVQIKPKDSSVERWQRIAEAAVTQCSSGYLMKIEPAVRWSDALHLFKEQPVLFADLREKKRTCSALVKQLEPPVKKIGILVGPEGDFSPEELSQIIDCGAFPVTLGSNILRVETAAIYSISAILDALA